MYARGSSAGVVKRDGFVTSVSHGISRPQCGRESRNCAAIPSTIIESENIPVSLRVDYITGWLASQRCCDANSRACVRSLGDRDAARKTRSE